MATVTLSSLGFNPSLGSSSTVQLKWRLASGSTYTNLPDATVNSSGGITNPVPYQFIVPVQDVVVRATNPCGTFDREFYIDYCCANGGVLSGTSCNSIETTAATHNSGTDITVCHYTNQNYSQYGTLFYKQGGYNTDGTYTTGNQPSAVLTTPVAGGTYSGTLWGNPSSNSSDGRLNKTALWSCSDQSYIGTIGFGFQINIPVSGVYYVAFGADNYATLSIDNVVLINQNANNIGTQLCGGSTHIECAFKYWHCYPVSLTSGVHLISVTGTNTGAVGAFGCEIYNATESVLTACTTSSGTYGNQSLAPTNLNRYIIFSTQSITNGTVSDVGNYTCSSGYTLIKAPDGSYSCQRVNTTPAPVCNSSKVGSLISPPSSALSIIPIYNNTIKYLRAGKTVGASGGNVYQTYSSAGYPVVLTLNSAPPVGGSPVAFPTGGALTTYFSGMDAFYSGNTYNIPLVAIQNEENNHLYWDLSNPTQAANDYLAMLTGAITRTHNSGRLVTNGGVTGPSLKWMVWKDLLDNQGSSVATAFANKVFDSTQVASLPNYPTSGPYQTDIAFLQAVIPAYKTLPLDYVNFHWYEPNHDEILSNTSIDPSAILSVVSYLRRVTGRNVVINEVGQHNMADNIVPQLLDTLMGAGTDYIMLYDGDGAGTGDAYAFHNTDGTIRPNGTAINNFLKTHK